jgi:hypothetical protein
MSKIVGFGAGIRTKALSIFRFFQVSGSCRDYFHHLESYSGHFANLFIVHPLLQRALLIHYLLFQGKRASHVMDSKRFYHVTRKLYDVL